MNRGILVFGIVIGFVAAAGGLTYYLTDRYGSPDELIAKAIPQGLGAPQSGPVAGPVAGPAAPGPVPPGPPPPSAPAAVEGAFNGKLDVGNVLNSFDYSKQHLVWVLPPGIHAEGPFVAHVSISQGDAVAYQADLPLTASKPESNAAFPAGSDVVRLSADENWIKQRDEIKSRVAAYQAAKQHGEVEITSDFKTKIDENYRRQYCMQGNKIVVDLYLEDNGQLHRVDIADAMSILQRTILTGGCKAPGPPPPG